MNNYDTKFNYNSFFSRKTMSNLYLLTNWYFTPQKNSLAAFWQMLEDEEIIRQRSICSLNKSSRNVGDDRSVFSACVLPAYEVVPTWKRNALIDEVNNKRKICNDEDDHENGDEHTVHFWWDEAHQKITVNGHHQACHQPRGNLKGQKNMWVFEPQNLSNRRIPRYGGFE